MDTRPELSCFVVEVVAKIGPVNLVSKIGPANLVSDSGKMNLLVKDKSLLPSHY